MASVVTIDSGSVCWLVQVDSSQRVCLRWLGYRPRHHGGSVPIATPAPSAAEQIAGMTHVRRSARPSTSASKLGATAGPALNQ